MAKDYIAPYILDTEYKCPCCDRFPPDFDRNNHILPYQMIFKKFAKIREAWGSGLPITSGYRCPEYNEEIGGAPTSVHMFGLALDIDCANAGEVRTLARLIDSLDEELRMGKYTEAGTFIHLDNGYMITPRMSLSWEQGIRWNG